MLSRPRGEFTLVTPYVALNFDDIPKKLNKPFGVFTHVSESILA